ncbi:beta-ketoacyl [acyl carrier protein] synthase domain-containing protein [Methyloversatilis universalis]|uniref:beta-ketoacyl [acyl carrier protein] synthase domain-containing protein n=1 Tax=Methyloversatilis universalis TaxID=378211 RepID=UPI00036E66DB|nr:polyketide synthase [Methyloversatilis universalis]
MQPLPPPGAIAIVGLAARLPGAADAAGFWDSLLADRPAIAEVPASRWDWRACHAAPGAAANTAYSNVGGFIDDVDAFDLRHFGIAPREAEAMDPMQRLFLQSAWTALEDAGIAPRSLSGRRVGVFAGVGNAEYTTLMRAAHCDNDAYRATGMALTLVANRLSYVLNLRGPSQVVDTACSGSLVAVHRAIEQLRLGQCELALAGGVSLMLSPELHVAFSQAGMLSTSGRCRPFDAEADGYVRGEGVGVVVLKRLDDALRDGDFIHACILASAENHGGRAHSLTAPSFKGQAEVVAAAWQAAGPAVRHLSHVETHGTGTPLGDPIEIAGLNEALRQCRAADPGCVPEGDIRLGALKARIGHLEAAAGIAGLIKTVLALRHGLIPGHPAFAQANPQLELSGSPLRIAAAPQAWGDGPRVAGVSSFGFGGVNAHIVLQAQPAPAWPARPGEVDIVLLSARDADTLRARAAQLFDYLHPGVSPQVLRALQQASGALDFDAPWPALGVSADTMARAAHAAAQGLGIDRVGLDLRDCMSWGEVAAALSEALPAPASPDRLQARATLPRHVLAPTLRALADSLFSGRDLQSYRLAVVAADMSELALQLVAWLCDGQATQVVAAQSAREPGAQVPAPDWQDAAQVTGWLRAQLALPALSEALSLRRAADRAPRVPLPTLPFRRDRVWFRSAAPATAAGPADTPYDIAALRAPWAALFGAPPRCLPTLLPWPAHAAAHAVSFVDVAWAAASAEDRRLAAGFDGHGLRYRTVAEAGARTLLRVARIEAGADALKGAADAPVAGDARSFDLDVDPPPLDPAGLWMHWTIAVVRALQAPFRDQARAPLLPYRAARVSWAALPAGGPQRLRVTVDSDSGRISLFGEAGGRTLLRIDGLELREARWLSAPAVAAAELQS